MSNDSGNVTVIVTVVCEEQDQEIIAYQQTDESESDHKCGLCHICPTFLGICYFIWLAVIVAVIIVMMRRKKET